MRRVNHCGPAALCIHAALALLLSACNSDGGDGIVVTSTQPASAKTYSFGTGVVGATSSYDEEVVDNYSDKIDLVTTDQVTNVNSDGSATQHLSEVATSASTYHGTLYGSADHTQSYDASHHLIQDYLTYETTDPGPIFSNTCSFSPSAAILPNPLYVGETWTSSWSESCSSGYKGKSTLTNGSVSGIESVTVPYGTFNALKIQYTITKINSNSGFAETDTITEWRSTNGNGLLKLAETFAYSSPPNGANGYAVSQTQVLDTVSP